MEGGAEEVLSSPPLLTDFLRLPSPTGCPEDTTVRTAGPRLPERDCCPLQPVCVCAVHRSQCVCAELLRAYERPMSWWECLILKILFQLSVRPISNESAKETKKPLAGSKDPSDDHGSHPSEAGAVPISSTQLVYVVSDLGRLQEWVSFAALVDAWICEPWGPVHPTRTLQDVSLLGTLSALCPLLLALRKRLTLGLRRLYHYQLSNRGHGLWWADL